MEAESATALSAASTTADRWEHGSNLPVSFDVGNMRAPWDTAPRTFWASGRDALRALVEWGVANHGWRRMYVPSYYCQDALVPLQSVIPMEAYAHGPTARVVEPVVAREGDIALVVSLFGAEPAPVVSAGGSVVDDHTHDPLSPWALNSTSEYAFASLRKTLPLPDGGVLWSPQRRPLPADAPVTLAHDRATLDRLAAMILKHHYLAGADVAKDEFRAVALRGEEMIGKGEVSGMSSYSRARLPSLPGAEWRERRAANLAALRTALGEHRGVTLLDVPFAAMLVFESRERRERVREALLQSKIYPTIYWPLEDPAVSGIPASDVATSRRILGIHCDYRYTAGDMERVAKVLQGALVVA